MTAEEIQAQLGEEAPVDKVLEWLEAERKAGEQDGEQKAAEPLKRKNKEIFAKLDELKPWKELAKERGLTPEEVAAALEEHEALKTKAQAEEVGVDADELSKLAEEKAQAKLEAYRAQQKTIQEKQLQERAAMEKKLGDLEKQRHEDRVEQALYRIAGNDVYADLWPEFVKRLTPVFHEDEETGELILMDPKTQTRLAGNEGELTLEELVDGFRASKGDKLWDSRGSNFFRPTGGGTGDRETARGNGRKVIPRGAQRSKMTPREKSAFIAEHGQEAFQQLPA